MKSRLRFTANVSRFDVNMSLHFIGIPDELVMQMADKFPFRVFCSIKSHRFPAAIVKHGLDGFVIQMGNQTVKAAKIRAGEEVEVLLEKDETEHGYEMPEEFEELLLQDEDGKEAWDALTKGAQRSFLYYLCSAKTQETKIKRGILILKRAREIIAEKAKKAKLKSDR